MTMCAERVAIGSAIAAGASTLLKIAIAVVDKNGSLINSFMPCGACRQVMQEFGRKDTIIIVAGEQSYTLGELLPLPF
jgi:cytidine deaminase